MDLFGTVHISEFLTLNKYLHVLTVIKYSVCIICSLIVDFS